MRGIPIYFGGMFETAAARRQLWTLAALLSPAAANDVAPLAAGSARPALPPRICVDATVPGFGAAASVVEA